MRHQNTLSLRGERKHEAEVPEHRSHRTERAYGAFQRTFVLPTLVESGEGAGDLSRWRARTAPAQE